MRGASRKDVVAENINSVLPNTAYKRWVNKKPMLCWKCQKDKPRQGGKERCLDGFGGKLRSFVCQDCLEDKRKKTNDAAD